MNEWPLVVFTVLLEFACGSAMAATLVDCMVRRPDLVPMRPVGISVFPVAALALLASLFHLGRPLAAWRALANLGNSRLSLEILLCALFTLVALVYSFLWWTERSRGRPAAGIALCLLGAAAAIASATVYLIPAQPAWNSGWVPCSLVGTALLFGGLIPLLLAAKTEGLQQKIFQAAVIMGGLALLSSAVWMLVRLSQMPADEFIAARLQEGLHRLASQHGLWLGLHIALGCVLPLVVGIRLWLGGSAHKYGPLSRLLIFLMILAGITIGRVLMFALESPSRDLGEIPAGIASGTSAQR
jgi:anaerobic dimethyl sulfoxide reductase subunit C (anchor subunit)